MKVFVTQKPTTRLRDGLAVIMEPESKFDSDMLHDLADQPMHFSQFLYEHKHAIPGDFVDAPPRVTRGGDGRVTRLEIRV